MEQFILIRQRSLLSQNRESPFLSHSARGLCITAVHHAAHRDGGGGVPGPLRIEAVTRTCGGGKSSLARMTPRQSEVDGPRPVSGGGGGATCALVAAAPTAVTRPGLHEDHVRLVARRRRPPRAGEHSHRTSVIEPDRLRLLKNRDYDYLAILAIFQGNQLPILTKSNLSLDYF